jgi:transposase InsO family protein
MRPTINLGASVTSISRGAQGDCWDNAVSESVVATLPGALDAAAAWATRAEARAAIFEYNEVWYNRERRHSSIGYVSPVEYEKMLANKEDESQF